MSRRKSPPNPGVRTSRIGVQRRGAVDVEAHAVALLDRRHGRLLAAPGERPDDREAGRDRRRSAARRRRQHAGAERSTSSSGHRRLSSVRAGLQLGQRASASGRRPAAARSRARPRCRGRWRRRSAPRSTHQPRRRTIERARRTSLREADHGQRREQRRRGGAQQDRGLEEVAEPQSSSARSRSRTPSVPVDHRVGLLLELARALVRAHARRAARSPSRPALLQLGQARGRRRGR